MSIASIIRRNLTQSALYWGSPEDDGYGGLTFDFPVAITCRWEDTSETIRNNNGKELITKATVYVSQDLEEEGYLFLGEAADLEDVAANPITIERAYPIIKFDKIPTLKTGEFIRVAYLGWQTRGR